MNIREYKIYVWIVLLSIIVFSLVLAEMDRRQWHRYTEMDIFQEILGTLPQSADSGRKVVVISNVDKELRKLLRDYAGISPEAEYILEPKNLNDLAGKLQSLAKGKPISRLTFFGEGERKENKVTIKFMKQDEHDEEIDRDDFIKLRKKYADLPSAFSPNAQVVFFNCWAGTDIELLEAAGKAFLLNRGGTVIANKELIRYEYSSSGMFWSKKYAVITWIDRPDETNWVRRSISRSNRNIHTF